MKVFANVTVNVTHDDIADLEKNGIISTPYGYSIKLIRVRERRFEEREPETEEEKPKKKSK